MTEPEFFDPPGYAETMGDTFHFSQAVKVGNRIETSGHGGWLDATGRTFPDTIEEEIAITFENLERTLNEAGASWKDVISLTSYHATADGTAGSIDPAVLEQITEELRRRGPDRRPIWTAVGTGLATPEMHIEISVTAIVAN
jgi:enamine deaminase RidA (YjgF/YER057c/UK114 family)